MTKFLTASILSCLSILPILLVLSILSLPSIHVHSVQIPVLQSNPYLNEDHAIKTNDTNFFNQNSDRPHEHKKLKPDSGDRPHEKQKHRQVKLSRQNSTMPGTVPQFYLSHKKYCENTANLQSCVNKDKTRYKFYDETGNVADEDIVCCKSIKYTFYCQISTSLCIYEHFVFFGSDVI